MNIFTKMNDYFESISTKDWKRMSDLVLTGKDYQAVVKSLKDKEKTINRFVTGLKLLGKRPTLDKWGKYTGDFSLFGNKALDLGATPEEIENLFNSTEVPEEFKDNSSKKGKKLDNGYVSFISIEVIKNGWDIEFLRHNGYAITSIGKESMERNGRKWTIGYKTIITIGDNKIKFNFDAITDEGGGPTYYCVDRTSDIFFDSDSQRNYMGKREFLNKLMIKLKKYEN